MSSNQLVNDSNNTNLKQVRNCVNPDLSKNMNVHYKSRSFDDPCFVDVHTRQSLGPGKYRTSNHYHCDCMAPEMIKTATSLPHVFVKNGNGAAGCVVDDGTKLRVGKTKKFPTDAIALPKNAVLTERENKLIVASIYEDSFEYFIEVQSFRWHMLKMPV